MASQNRRPIIPPDAHQPSSTPGNGVGLAGVLVVVLIVLKLTHAIKWSWWWVTSPLWATGILTVIAVFVAVLRANRHR